MRLTMTVARESDDVLVDAVVMHTPCLFCGGHDRVLIGRARLESSGQEAWLEPWELELLKLRAPERARLIEEGSERCDG